MGGGDGEGAVCVAETLGGGAAEVRGLALLVAFGYYEDGEHGEGDAGEEAGEEEDYD